MRLVLATFLVALPLAAIAQPAPSPAPGPGRGAITRDQFIQRASDAAARRFDAIDVNHTGSITRDQMRAWRQAHPGPGAGGPAQAQ